jgi:glyoxylase-like metal-dependent hydrolase (beta-lactamase superfamily II)/rhodanese-related sulfurtransferase
MMTLHQIRSIDGTGTLSYLLTDASRSAILIDPNIEDLPLIRSRIAELGVELTRVIDTHTHADHVSAAGELKRLFAADVVMHENTKNKWKSVEQGDAFGIGDTLRANAAIPIDRYVRDGDSIVAGSLRLEVLYTPGHTDNHIALAVEDAVFTGDLLLIGQAGRSDLPGGNPEEQFDSLFSRVLPLPGRTRIFPGHDYADNEFAYLEEERRTNPFLQRRTKAEYVEFVKDFFPPLAEGIAPGGKMTLQCGVQRVSSQGSTIKNVTPAELSAMLAGVSRPLLIDVREPVELLMSGAIEGVRNIPVGSLMRRLSEVPKDAGTDIVVVCQSGSRSTEAAHVLQRNGYQRVHNLSGGTSAWIRSGFPVIRQQAAKV